MKEREAAVEEAAGYLRLALPLMSKHQTPVTPINYAVWYEYVSGVNQALRDAIDELMGAEVAIDGAKLQELYEAHIMPPDEARVNGTRDSVAKLIEEVASIVSDAGGDASRYQASLAEYCERLTPDAGIDEVTRVVEGLTAETRAVCDASEGMHKRLEDSRQEVQALRAELEQVREEASCDVLTGLTNRKGLQEAFDAAAGRADNGESHCMIIGDIDHFKQVNDTHGHVVGDKVIKHVANIIRTSVKGKDTASRYGGEEFAVLLPDTPYSGAMALAENVRGEVEKSRLVKTNSRESIGTITISIGVARFRPGESLEDLIGRADAALYRAKTGGRNRVEPESDDAPATGTDG